MLRCTLYATNDFWDKSFHKQALGQIVLKTDSGTNRSKNKLWNKLLQTQALGQIVPNASSETNRSKNKLRDKSFQKPALGQIVPKHTLGQTVPKKKKIRPNKFSPSSPLKKKGPGVLPAERLNPPALWARAC